MSQMVGRCDWCKRRRPLFIDVPQDAEGAFCEDYLCEHCIKYLLFPCASALSPRTEHGDDGGCNGEEER